MCNYKFINVDTNDKKYITNVTAKCNNIIIISIFIINITNNIYQKSQSEKNTQHNKVKDDKNNLFMYSGIYNLNRKNQKYPYFYTRALIRYKT